MIKLVKEEPPAYEDRDYYPPGEPWPNDESAPLVQAQSKRGGDFLRSYVPMSYAIEGLLPSGFLYGLTGRRGDGKTAWLIIATVAVIKGEAKKFSGSRCGKAASPMSRRKIPTTSK